jgi:hypothetical protein
VENTCKGKECWFYLLIKDLSGDKSESLDFQNCPFYVEMMFTPNPVGGKVETAKLIKDCVNKRSLLMLLEEVQPRLIGVQKSNEEMRNRSAEAVQTVDQFMSVLSRIRREPELKTYVPPVEIEGKKDE